MVRFYKLLGSALALAVISTTAHAQVKAGPNGLFLQMLAETGCDSKYSDDKEADLFRTQYKNKQMTVTGEVSTVRDGEVSIKVLRTTLTHDIQVKLADKKAAYDLEKGQRVTVSFKVTYHGGCILSYSGEDGVLVNLTN